MAKQSGIGANLYLGSADLSGDVGAVGTISSPRGSVEVTGLPSPAPERLLTLRDGKLSFTGFWNTDTGQIFDTLSAMPTTDVLGSLLIPAGSGLAVGDVGCAINGKQLNFDLSRGTDGSLGVTSELDANGSALEWGQLLTAGKESRATGSVNGTALDAGASSSFGCAAYLHVFSMPSGTMTAKLQDSPDNSSWSDLAGMAFTSVTGPGAQRIVAAHDATVNEYVRLVTAGTHGTAVVACLLVRYATDQAI